MKRTLMLCLALLAGGAISAKAQTRVIVSFGVGTPGYAGFVSVGQPWYWYGGERVYYVRRYYEGLGFIARGEVDAIYPGLPQVMPLRRYEKAIGEPWR